MKRREFLNAAALTAGGTMIISGSHELLEAQAPAGRAPPARGGDATTPKQTYKTRPGKVEILFKAPGLSGNGMQVTDEGIWTIDIAGSRGDTPGRCKVYLSSFDGKLVRELAPEGTGPSGMGHDGKSIWIGSTYSREIIRADAKTGETMEKHFTPGAGVIYRRTTDIPARPDTYGQKVRAEVAAARGETVPARRGGGAVAAVAAQSRPARTRARARVMVSASAAVARSPGIPARPRLVLARTAFRRRTASCGLPSRPVE